MLMLMFPTIFRLRAVISSCVNVTSEEEHWTRDGPAAQTSSGCQTEKELGASLQLRYGTGSQAEPPRTPRYRPTSGWSHSTASSPTIAHANALPDDEEARQEDVRDDSTIPEQEAT